MENNNHSIEQKRDEFLEYISKEGDEIRKRLLDKLFSLNSLLSAAFLVLFQLNEFTQGFKLLNTLPFISVIIILFYQLFQFQLLGNVYNKVTRKREDYFC